MKIGDLVRRKFMTFASMRRAQRQLGCDPQELGVVIEESNNACKVMFPGSNGIIRSYMKSSLEVIE